jgi:hypothetical protein
MNTHSPAPALTFSRTINDRPTKNDMDQATG